MLSAVMPMYARLIFPSCISLSTTPLTVLTGTEIPRLLAYAALIPIIRPLASTSGPPEYPGLSRASVTTTLSIVDPHHPRTLYAGFVTIPDVALGCLPKGLLTARTNCPTLRLSEFPGSTGVRLFESIFNSAMSENGSRPATMAVCLVPSLKPTSTSRISPMTWLLVTMCPSLLQTVPVPPLHLPAPTWTTDRDTRSVTSTIASETDSRIADELVCLLIFSPTPVGAGGLFVDQSAQNTGHSLGEIHAGVVSYLGGQMLAPASWRTV